MGAPLTATPQARRTPFAQDNTGIEDAFDFGRWCSPGGTSPNDGAFAWSVVDQLKDALPPGGHLALYEAADTVPAHNEAIRFYDESGAAPYHLRSPGQIARFFDGL